MNYFIIGATFVAVITATGLEAQEQETPAKLVEAMSEAIELAPQVTLRDIKVELLEDKGVMQLQFSVANESGSDTSLMKHDLALSYGLKDIGIVDFASRKRYAMGFANGCLCSSFPDRDGGIVRAGATRTFWAWFGLPNEKPAHVAVQFPGRQPVMNVPVL